MVFKDILPQNETILKWFFFCYFHHLTYQNRTFVKHIICKIEAVFKLFYCLIFDTSFCYLVE